MVTRAPSDVGDQLHMSRALALAERGRGRTTPNPLVGAVVVAADGVVVGRGAHLRAGGPHAEVEALNEAGDRARGATLFCTLEPCVHIGRTAPCAPKVVAAGIRRAVIAMADPNPLAGGGITLLREHGLDVSVGICGTEAERLNPGFLTRMRKGRPFVTMKVALTLDGCVAAAPGARTRLTGPRADRFVHHDRAETDAIVVGSGTVLSDDPLLTPRGAFRYRPLVRVVLDRRLRTPPGARLLSTESAGPVIIISTEASVRRNPEAVRGLTASGARVEVVSNRDSMQASFLEGALDRIASLDCNAVIVEGGPTLHTAFWRANLVDRVQLFLTPRVVGPAGVPWDVLPIGTLARLRDPRHLVLGSDLLIEGYVHRAH